MTTEDKIDPQFADINEFIPRPEQGPTKRHMIAVEPDAYAYITKMAEGLDTTRNRVVTALVEFYRAEES